MQGDGVDAPGHLERGSRVRTIIRAFRRGTQTPIRHESGDGRLTQDPLTSHAPRTRRKGLACVILGLTMTHESTRLYELPLGYSVYAVIKVGRIWPPAQRGDRYITQASAI